MKKVVFSIAAALIVAYLAVPISAGASDSVPGQIDIRIGSLRNAYQGGLETIPIIAETDSYSIGRFNFLIGWDSKAMDLTDIRPGLFHRGATGEIGRFDVTYNQVELPAVDDACSGELLSGFVEITGNDFTKSSDTTQMIPPTENQVDTLCVLEFRMTDNRLFELVTTDIHFVWNNCDDNLIHR